MNKVEKLLDRRPVEPDVRRRVPAGLLDAGPRLLGQDPLHGLAQQPLGHAIADLHEARHPEHELHKPVVKEGIGVAEPGRLRRLRSSARRQHGAVLAKDILIGPVLEPARKWVVEHGLEAAQIVVVGRLDRRIVTAQALAIDQNLSGRISGQSYQMPHRGVAVLAIDRTGHGASPMPRFRARDRHQDRDAGHPQN